MADANSTDVQDDKKPSSGYSNVVMLLLFIVYAFNFLDRQIISILAIPIKEELGLSDEQLGLLGGIAFAALYSTLGVPIAWAADRWNRTWIMTISLTVWSAFTAISGLAQNFTQLFLARMGVGIGEAGGVAPAYSLIADYFPSNQRARAMAIYSLGIPVGSAFGVIVGAHIAMGAFMEGLDWRSAFIIVGVAGVVVAPIFKLIVREPKRGQFDGAAQQKLAEKKPSIMEVLKVLSKKPSFWFLTLGASFSSMMGYGIFFWIPSFFVRSHGLGILDTSWAFGITILVAGALGILMGGILGDRLGKGKKSMYAIVPGIAFLCTTPFYIGAVMAPSLAWSIGLFFIPTALGLAWLGPVLSTFQHLVAPNMRAVASSIFLLINNLIGIGVGVYVLGKMSTILAPTFGDESLRYSILGGSFLYLIAAGLFYLASKHIDKDWVSD